VIELVVAALLPVITVLGLGYFAGWHGDFDRKQAPILTRMVMLYALPLLLFAGTASIPRNALLAQLPLALILALGMVVPYVVVLLGVSVFFRRSRAAASLRALAVASPAVPFVGVSVLGRLFGDSTPDVPVAVSTLVLNLLLIPTTVFMLSRATSLEADATSNASSMFFDQVRDTIREPIVWSPFLALIFALTGIPLPVTVKQSMLLLGQTSGGVALFACGVLLYSYKVSFTPPVAAMVVARTIVVPAVAWALLGALKIPSEMLRVSVLTLGFPTMAVVAILAVRFRTAEPEMASVILFANAFWIAATGAFIWMTM
jgi:malonate transporter